MGGIWNHLNLFLCWAWGYQIPGACAANALALPAQPPKSSHIPGPQRDAIRWWAAPWDQIHLWLPPPWLQFSPGHLRAASQHVSPFFRTGTNSSRYLLLKFKEDTKDIQIWGSGSISQQKSYFFSLIFHTKLKKKKPIPREVQRTLSAGWSCFQMPFWHHKKAQASEWSDRDPSSPLVVINGSLMCQ